MSQASALWGDTPRRPIRGRTPPDVVRQLRLCQCRTGSYHYCGGPPNLRKGRLRNPCYGAAEPASPQIHPWLRFVGIPADRAVPLRRSCWLCFLSLGVFVVLLLSLLWLLFGAVLAWFGAPRLCWGVWLWAFVVVLWPAVSSRLLPLLCRAFAVFVFFGCCRFVASCLWSAPVGSSAFLVGVLGFVLLVLVLSVVLPPLWFLRALLFSFFGFLPRGSRARARRRASGVGVVFGSGPFGPSGPLAGSGLFRVSRSAALGG